MFTAYCLNEDCDKDEWELRKNPNQYARGGPACPSCGTSRVRVDGDEAQPQQAAQPAPAQQGGKQGQMAAAEQMAASLPSTQEAVSGGMQVGSLVAGLNSEDPQEQAVARGRGLKMLGSALAQVGDHTEQEAVERNQRAKEATQDQIGVVDDYVQAPCCGEMLTDLPVGEFSCPGCGKRLEFEPQ